MVSFFIFFTYNFDSTAFFEQMFLHFLFVSYSNVTIDEFDIIFHSNIKKTNTNPEIAIYVKFLICFIAFIRLNLFHCSDHPILFTINYI